jgi:hypothetical protein
MASYRCVSPPAGDAGTFAEPAVPCGHSPDPLAGPEPLQHPQAVRRQRHIRAGLGQLLRLLIDLDVDPARASAGAAAIAPRPPATRPQCQVLPPVRP